MKKYISVTIFMVILFASAVANNATDTIYTYYDAARNKYTITGNELEYIPVNARESSSGIYSGGTYASKVLTEKESQELVQLFKAAIANKKAQTNKNIKPNAAVTISTGNKKINFLLKSKSKFNIAINNFLKQLIKN